MSCFPSTPLISRVHLEPDGDQVLQRIADALERSTRLQADHRQGELVETARAAPALVGIELYRRDLESRRRQRLTAERNGSQGQHDDKGDA
jgi:hypothetical protein